MALDKSSYCKWKGFNFVPLIVLHCHAAAQTVAANMAFETQLEGFIKKIKGWC